MLGNLVRTAMLPLLLFAGHASAAEYQVTKQPGLVYAEHDGTKLIGDFYLPMGLAKAPAVVAVHGGGWQNGNRTTYQYWGPFLARHGIALFTIDYRLGKPGAYPAAVYDARAAIQFVRGKAAGFNLDPDRIGLIGDSAGGHLVALLGLAADQFTAAYRDDPMAATAANVKAVVGFYGVYDMLAQWTHDLVARPRDNIAEKFLGAAPTVNRRIYFESSPISYATVDRKEARFLLIHGTNDDIVDPPSQSGAFLTALNQAGIPVRRIVVPGAGHFWASDPFEDEPAGFGALTAPRLLRFLQGAL
jgi:acetyl esterase/lipase